jgi:hypothetical protein
MKTKSDINRILLSSVLFCSVIATFAQNEFDETKMVGFGCFYEGRETKVVSRFGKMLKQKRYPSLKRLLQSGNSAERLMAVLCLERLSAAGRLIITAEEKVQIGQIKTSTELVAVCSGCFPHPGIPLKEAFESDILRGATAWLDRHVKD